MGTCIPKNCPILKCLKTCSWPRKKLRFKKKLWNVHYEKNTINRCSLVEEKEVVCACDWGEHTSNLTKNLKITFLKLHTHAQKKKQNKKKILEVMKTVYWLMDNENKDFSWKTATNLMKNVDQFLLDLQVFLLFFF